MSANGNTPAPRPVRIYLAGPMTGYEGLNFPAFHRAAAALREAGFDVVNPAEINTDPTARWEDCMRADIAQLVTCERIALLPGWEQSRGARIEASIANALGMPPMYLDQLQAGPRSRRDLPPPAAALDEEQQPCT